MYMHRNTFDLFRNDHRYNIKHLLTTLVFMRICKTTCHRRSQYKIIDFIMNLFSKIVLLF